MRVGTATVLVDKLFEFQTSGDGPASSFPATWLAATFCLSVLLPAAAHAQQTPPLDELDGMQKEMSAAASSAREGYFLPTVEPAGGLRSSPGIVKVIGGYDGGKSSALMRATGDVKVVGPLDVRMGLAYTKDNQEGQVQPLIGARVRMLNQDEHTVDLTAALYYRMERFTDDEGFVQGLLALSRHNRNNDAEGNRIAEESNEYVFVYDVSGLAPEKRQVLQVPNTFNGVAWHPSRDEFYVSGGVDDNVHVYALASNGWAEVVTIPLGHEAGEGSNVQPMAAGLSVNDLGTHLLVTNFENDSVSLATSHGVRAQLNRTADAAGTAQ